MINYYPSQGQSVAVVGAGITGLVTAHTLAKHGLRVTIVDKNNDPRICPTGQEAENTSWRFNARQITLAESHSFLSQSTSTLLQRDLMYGGWNALPRYMIGLAERNWLHTFHQLASRDHTVEEHNQQLLHRNQRGMTLWKKLQQELPTLFGCNPTTRTITRIHKCTKRLSADFALHSSFDSENLTPLTPEEVVKNGLLTPHPTRLSTILGGLLVEGFSIEAQNFCLGFLDWLEAQGITFLWNTDVTARRNRDTVILSDADDVLLAFNHYVICPGAYGLPLLDSCVPDHQIHGLAGTWIQIRNPGVQKSCKIHYANPLVEDINLCLGRSKDTVFLSGGYGYIGTHSINDTEELLKPLQHALVRKTKTLFPRLRSSDILDEGYCLRPFDARGLSLYKQLQSPSGKCIVTAGHGTGGWTQAPYIAQKVLRDIVGVEKESFLPQEGYST